MPKTYKNISGFTQFDIEPGETGERELSQDEEERAVARGAIEVVGDNTESSTDKPETDQAVVDQPEKTPEEIEAEQKAADEAAAAAKAEAERGGRRGRG